MDLLWCGPKPLTAAREPSSCTKSKQEREAGLPTVRSRTQSQQNTRAKRREARGKRKGLQAYSAAKPRLEHKLTAWTISHEGQYTGRRSCKLQESVLQKLLSSGPACWFSMEPSLSEKREAIQKRVPGPLNGAPHWSSVCGPPPMVIRGWSRPQHSFHVMASLQEIRINTYPNQSPYLIT